MNFKKYHVSKNLIDYKTIFSQFIDSNGDISGRVSQIRKWVNFTAEDIGKTLTLSFYAKSVSASYIRVQAQINGEYVTGNNINAGSSGYSEITITPTSTDDVWRITYGNDAEIVVNQVMLEESSTRTAYEPYSSEVWHDIPYYVHNTSTDAITTLPADIYANAATATVGLKGQTVQSGTPTPQNPVMPNGTGERTGNLFDKNATDTNNGYVGNGYLLSDGTITTSSSYRISEYIPISSNQKYITYAAGLNAPSVCFYDANKNYISGVNYAGRLHATFTTPSDAKYLRLSFRAVDADISFLNLGDTALPYEPYGYELTISSANTTTPVYLGEVETERRIQKVVFNGTENWTEYGSGSSRFFYTSISQTGYNDSKLVMSTHFQYTSGSSAAYSISLANNGTTLRVYDRETNWADATAFKTWLAAQYSAGTPVTVWYVLASEETAVVNEPLMKIGDYADTLSNVSIPVIAGGDTISVGTTVQPSEITVNYKGWHPKTPKESNNGQWS